MHFKVLCMQKTFGNFLLKELLKVSQENTNVDNTLLNGSNTFYDTDVCWGKSLKLFPLQRSKLMVVEPACNPCAQEVEDVRNSRLFLVAKY